MEEKGTTMKKLSPRLEHPLRNLSLPKAATKIINVNPNRFPYYLKRNRRGLIDKFCHIYYAR